MPEMRYAPPGDVEMDSTKPVSPPEYDATAAQIQPTVESGPRMVTPLEQVGAVPVDVDCPYCKKVVRTRVEQVDADGSGMMQCLICLVCWPMLFCYESDKDIDHYCSVPTCKRKLTHQPHGGRPQAVPVTQGQSRLVASQYEQFEQK